MRTTTAICLAALLAAVGCRDRHDPGLRASGTFEVEKVRIVATAPGKLVSFPVEEGDRLGADHVVAVIDTGDLELKKEEALAGLSMVKAKLKLVENGVRPEDIKQLRAVQKEVKLEKSLADKNVERLVKLHASGGISQSTLDEAETQRDVVASKLSQVKWQLEKARTGAQVEEIDAARAAVVQLEAGLKQLDKLIADRTITTPVEGTVLETYVHEGEFVYAGQLLATVADVEDVDLIVYVPETDLPHVRLGQAVRVSIDAFPDRRFEGKVAHIADEAEFTPSTIQTEDERVKLVFEVKVKVPNPDGYFKPGLPADVTFGRRTGG
jgi:HlyD family secretion protein